MIFIEVNQASLDAEISRLRDILPGSEVMQAFYGGAIFALEWLRDGTAAPSSAFEADDGTDG